MSCGPRFPSLVFTRHSWFSCCIALLESCLRRTGNCRLNAIMLSFILAANGMPLSFAGIPDGIQLIRISSLGEHGPVYLHVGAKKLSDDKLAVGPLLLKNGEKKAFFFELCTDGMMVVMKDFDSKTGLEGTARENVRGLAYISFEKRGIENGEDKSPIYNAPSDDDNDDIGEGESKGNTDQTYNIRLTKSGQILHGFSDFFRIERSDNEQKVPLEILRDDDEEAIVPDMGLIMNFLLAEANRSSMDDLISKLLGLTFSNIKEYELFQTLRYVPQGEVSDITDVGVASLSSLSIPYKKIKIRGAVSSLPLYPTQPGEFVHLITYPNLPENGVIIGPFGIQRYRGRRDPMVRYVIYITQPNGDSFQFELLEDTEATVEHSVWNNKNQSVVVHAGIKGGFSLSVEGKEVVSDPGENMFDDNFEFETFGSDIANQLKKMINYDHLLSLMSDVEQEVGENAPYDNDYDDFKAKLKDVFKLNQAELAGGYLSENNIIFDQLVDSPFKIKFADNSMLPMQRRYNKMCGLTGLVFGPDEKNNTTFYHISLGQDVKQGVYIASRMSVDNMDAAWEMQRNRRLFGVMEGCTNMSAEYLSDDAHIVSVTRDNKELQRLSKQAADKLSKKILLFGKKENGYEILPDAGAVCEMLEAHERGAPVHLAAEEFFILEFDEGLQSGLHESQVRREHSMVPAMQLTPLRRIIAGTPEAVTNTVKGASNAIVGASYAAGKTVTWAGKKVLLDTPVFAFNNTVGRTLKVAASRPKTSTVLLVGGAASAAYYAGYTDIKALQTVGQAYLPYIFGNGTKVIDVDVSDKPLLPPGSKNINPKLH